MLAGCSSLPRFLRFGVPPVETIDGLQAGGADARQRFIVKCCASAQPVSVGYSMKPAKLRPADAAISRAS